MVLRRRVDSGARWRHSGEGEGGEADGDRRIGGKQGHRRRGRRGWWLRGSPAVGKDNDDCSGGD
ncbi:hypothetical protein E2562_036331 [Oryza meyeriana var. granulata]|uniref:Uncharacterized protein n=1 Tax=Oryza meyeriana var. granulata TaxID=110450 RepID=A0A6G1DS69_9ORYZ|nr:hypothetical protein E2562_036331 [Oryza meyeriana var. granulata]